MATEIATRLSLNHVYIGLMYIVYVGQINEILIQIIRFKKILEKNYSKHMNIIFNIKILEF